MTPTPPIEQHPAVAEFFNRHGRMPIITHLTDTDLYKFTMQQSVLHQFPDADAEYRFKCRTPDVDLRHWLRKSNGSLSTFASYSSPTRSSPFWAPCVI